MPLELGPYLDERRRLIERRLDGYLDKETGAPADLNAAMRYSLLGPGKRLRPLLVLMAAEACGGRLEQALPAACAIEMVHCYSLVHDDLPAMDDDDLRRGRPTSHKQFGESTAILVGDALVTLAFQVLADGVEPAELAIQCCVDLAKAAGPAGMVGGQLEDLAWERRDDGTLANLEQIHHRKTGALFQAALRMGGRIGLHHGGAAHTDNALAALDGYATALGLAFQISDDLIDVEGNQADTGKRVGKDAGRGKLTYPGFLGVVASRGRLDAVCAEALDSLTALGPSAEPLAALVDLIRHRDR